jgi:metal-sulfur cluster biosynthetic enzyme
MNEQTSQILVLEPASGARQIVKSEAAVESLAAPSPWGDPAKIAELALMGALRTVVDPELGMDIVELGLIRELILGAESSEIKMVLTTVFCPYAPQMIAEIQMRAEEALGHPVKVTLLAEAWDPREAGLVW